MSAPLVSFVVPCYNYGRYLRDCLNGIFAQEGEFQMEVIAINDCSTDDTLAILRSYDDPRLPIINHETNRGHIFTVNEGIELPPRQNSCRLRITEWLEGQPHKLKLFIKCGLKEIPFCAHREGRDWFFEYIGQNRLVRS